MATNFDKLTNETRPDLVKKTMVLRSNLVSSSLTLEDLLAETRRYLSPDDMEGIERAYNLAKQAHQGVARVSGEPYIQHPLEVAFLLAEMRIDAEGIIAALLHDVVED